MTLRPGKQLGARLQVLSLTEEARLVSYSLDPHICAVPGCEAPPMRGVHHIEPRSATGGPRAFVVIDSQVRPNTCRLCWEHHRLVSGDVGGHKARIIWHSDRWWWQEIGELGDAWGWQFVGRLRGIEGMEEEAA